MLSSWSLSKGAMLVSSKWLDLSFEEAASTDPGSI